jgi:GNAT superfamily N-acetyltransferase
MNNVLRVCDAESIRRCFPVMVQLRPHLNEACFCEQVRRQMESQDYHLVALEHDGTIVAVAGYRFAETLAWGRYIYVDDLIADEACRGKGYGGQLLDWLVDEVARKGCGALHLDSGVQRFAAHRFYLGKGMDVTCRHFALDLPTPATESQRHLSAS